MKEKRKEKGFKINSNANNLVTAYPKDLEISIRDKLVHFSTLLKTDLAAAFDGNIRRKTHLHTLIKENRLETAFPNVEVALRIYCLC